VLVQKEQRGTPRGGRDADQRRRAGNYFTFSFAVDCAVAARPAVELSCQSLDGESDGGYIVNGLIVALTRRAAFVDISDCALLNFYERAA
jgi:hypothetical protein